MVEFFTLPNGVKIVHEHLPHLRSCSLGIWVQSGSRHEPEELCGISHFIEHMLFKGTEKYSAAQLAEEFDTVGGQVNAFTTKENTCYYVRTLDAQLQRAAALLADMFFNSAFAQAETDLERGVIVEEIGMYEDTPEDLCNELLFAEIYRGSTLSLPILGTVESLRGIQGPTLRDYRHRAYTPENTLISLSGSYSKDDLDFICGLFGSMEKTPPPEMGAATYTAAVALKRKDIEQNHLIVGFPGINLGSEKRYTMQVLNSILGAGMSSRLFQQVREKNGLCYTVYSFASMYSGAGLFGIYTALNKNTERQALALIRSEVEAFKKNGVTKIELERTKEQLKTNVLMGMESTVSRMSAIARSQLNYGRNISEEEIVAGLEAVTAEDISDLSREIMDFDSMSFSAVGDVSAAEEYMNVMKG